MIDFTRLLARDVDQRAHSIHLTDPGQFDAWLKSRSAQDQALARAQGLEPKEFSSAILPGGGDDDWSVICVVADTKNLGPWSLARLPEMLPEGGYRLIDAHPGKALHGWLCSQYEFDRYKKADHPSGSRLLLCPDGSAIENAIVMADATFKLRDRINTGANDMGPAALEAIATDLASAHGAQLTVTKGKALADGYGLIWAVGKAAAEEHAPRLIELAWGSPDHPKVAIIGKGVCFDTGGLNIKNGPGMLRMKTDMGGAAHALALAELVMRHRLPIRLHLLIPAVENAIGSGATRPGDVMISRKGITVENTNTDAEGRLILADAITKAGEADPELVIDFATLTGAARVALGLDLQALFTNDDDLAAALCAAAESEADPIWRLPLWAPYKDTLKSGVADLINAPEAPFGGAIAGGLFLEEFVPPKAKWAHLDIHCWNGTARPGRPMGAEAVGLRATWKVLQDRYAAPRA